MNPEQRLTWRPSVARSGFLFLAIVITLLGLYAAAGVWDAHRRVLPNDYEIMRESSGNCSILKDGRPGVHDSQGRLVLDEYVTDWHVRGSLVWGFFRLPPCGLRREFLTLWYCLDTQTEEAEVFDSRAQLRSHLKRAARNQTATSEFNTARTSTVAA